MKTPNPLRTSTLPRNLCGTQHRFYILHFVELNLDSTFCSATKWNILVCAILRLARTHENCLKTGWDVSTMLDYWNNLLKFNIHLRFFFSICGWWSILLNIMFFTDGKISVRINLPLFSTVLPSNSCYFCPVGFLLLTTKGLQDRNNNCLKEGRGLHDRNNNCLLEGRWKIKVN